MTDRPADADDRGDDRGIEELLARAREGDRAAENALFDRLRARTLALAKRRVREEETAQDLAQQTMETVFAKYREADLPRGLLPWVFTILHHKVGNWLKRRRVEVRTVAGGDPERAWDTVGVSGEKEYDVVDLKLALEQALRRATPECRRIYRLLLAEAGRDAIRDAFPGEPMGTIDSRISRCRRKLLRYLEITGARGHAR